MTQKPGVLFAPRAHVALERGIDRMAAVIRPTLGPTPRTVAIENASPGRPPEILDDAATILRRIIQIPNPYVDMGAMLIRHTLSRMSKTVGDGTATTGVLLQALVHRGARYVRAGGDPVAFRRGLEKASAAAVQALQDMAEPLEDKKSITRAADAICHDAEMARLLGEIFDIVGKDGHVQVDEHPRPDLERQYVEGAHWNEGMLSPYFISDEVRREARLDNPAIFLSNLRFTTADQLAPLLQLVVAQKRPGVMIVAREVSGTALSLLVSNHQAKHLQIVAVRAPSYGDNQTGILQDLAILTGARVFMEEAGDQAQRVQASDLGGARHAWATSRAFGLRSGMGDARQLRERIIEVRAVIKAATDAADKQKAQERLGRLQGGVAILQVGAPVRNLLDARKATAERTVTTLRLALQRGVVPGGGTAYIRCQEALDKLDLPEDEQFAVNTLRAALEEPLAVIAHNAGYDPKPIIRQVQESDPTEGFDARTGKIVDMWEAGIVDPLEVLESALKIAVSGAAMVLTTDVLIHQRNPQTMVEP